MYSKVSTYCNALTQSFDSIPAQRKEVLLKITGYIKSKLKEGRPVNLVYICTHNSRRSHFGQVWAHVAADYFKIKNVTAFSGGSEATAFNPNAIAALGRAGFEIKIDVPGENPKYSVYHDANAEPCICFSKVYDDAANPTENFAAIMVCGEAEQNCPFVAGADLRISTTYEDPKDFDNTPLQDQKYDERCRQVAVEIFYVFSQVSR